MDGLAWIQVGSLVAVCLALGVSTYQVWLARQQTLAAQKAAASAITAGTAEARNAVLYNNPELLSWFLRYRGFAADSLLENKKRLFITQKLLHDEAVFTAHRRGFIDDEDWKDWTGVVKADIVVDEARHIWPQVRYLYAENFAIYVDSVIKNFEDELNMSDGQA